MSARFIMEANIAHYKELLAKESDPKKIETLRKLLADEEARLAEYNKDNLRRPSGSGK